jgi:C_GCAxxG_C_C family probable redox protein
MTTDADKAEAMFREGFNCAQAVAACCGAGQGLDRPTAVRVAQAFGGGMCMGDTCGAVTGAFMVIGLAHANLTGQDAQEKAKAHELVLEFRRRFEARHKSVQCNDLLGVDYATDEGKRLARERGLFKTLCPKFVHDAAEIVEELLK